MPKTITFDRQEVANLKRYYNKAVKDQTKSFFFRGNILLTAYAKYLIEYLDSQFKK
jgi:hypothetical protein